MKVLVVLGLALCASAYVVPEIEENTAYGYLEKYAIPLAEKIRKAEDEMRLGRIVGGSPARLGQFPYQAGLVITFVNRPGVGVCGGSLISSSRVLTAAHCWFDGIRQAREFVVVLGSVTVFSGGTRLTTNSIVLHPQWSPNPVRNDIAVIRLPRSVSFSGSIAAIALPSGSQLNEGFVGATAVASGFGLTRDGGSIASNQFLSFVNLNVVSNRDCGASFVNIATTVMCTRAPAGRNICASDSGGPLAITRNNRPLLIGVVSFGGPSCEAGLPAGFTRVTHYINFIRQNM